MKVISSFYIRSACIRSACAILAFGFFILSSTQTHAAENCRELLIDNPNTSSGTYSFTINGETFQTYCDMKNGGWTLAARAPTSNRKALTPVGTLDLNHAGRLSDHALSSLLQKSTGAQNNVKVEVEDSFPPYTISMATPTDGLKGLYQVEPEANGYCSAFNETMAPARYYEHVEWKFLNGNMTGGIGYADMWGFHVDVCDASTALACGAQDQENCDDFLRGSLWIR